MRSSMFLKSSRMAVILGLTLVMTLAIGATVWGQPGTGQCCYTAPGQFRFPTDAVLQAQIGSQPVSLRLMGPTMVRTLNAPPNPIQTEMLALELTGMSPMGGGVGLHLTPGTTSTGQTSGLNSFFDVFTELSFEQAPWTNPPGQPDDVYTGFPNNQYIPVRVINGNLQCIPPQPGATWTTPAGTNIPLTSRRLNAVIGQLTAVVHTAIDPGHFKTWSVFQQDPIVTRTVVARDQFMQDNLVLDSILYLSNPVQKCVEVQPGVIRCFNVADSTEHFSWYRARGNPANLEVEFENQFQRDTILIDSVEYFLLPTQKFPHHPPKLLDHYKAYRIRNPQPLPRAVQLLDQFDQTPEFINTLIPRYFLTPAQKNTEPVFDTLTHFVAYEIFPKRPNTQIRDIADQFGVHIVQVRQSEFLLVPTCKIKFQPPPQDEACCFTGPAGSLMCALVPAGTCTSVYGGTVVPACLGDGNGNGVDDACDGPPTTGPNHFKTWTVFQQDQILPRTVIVQDQLMQDNLVLDTIKYLSNPTRKTVFTPNGPVTYPVLDTNDHLSWYRAIGRDTLLGIEYQNQFGHDTVNIDRLRYLLVPTRKFPHDPPIRLDHYKAYRIRGAKTLRQPIELEDQFDRMGPPPILPERIDSLRERFFLTPAQKQIPGQQPDPVYDTITHYVAYQIYPTRRIPHIRDLEDQFGIHVVQVDSAELLLVPTRKLKVIFPPPPEEACCYIDPTGVQVCDSVPVGTCQSVYGGSAVPACMGDGNGNGNDDACEPPQPDTGSNHYKTWRVLQQDQIQFLTVFAKDQFQKFKKDSTVRIDTIQYLSNPTRKIVFDATGADTFNVVDTTDHLSWYRATGYNLLKGLHIIFRNQFHTDTNRVDRVRYFLVPTRKFPHQPPDQLDHYKAYRIRKPKTLRKPFELQDQFDLMIPANPIERIDSLVERYFLTPTQKQIPGQLPEPTYDTVTHYTAYQIYPPRRIPHIRDTEDQFGIHILQVDSSELLLVPTTKLFVARKLKGDLNGSLDLSPADVVLMLNCVFLGQGDCDLSFSDMDCNEMLSPADVVLELRTVFLDEDLPC